MKRFLATTATALILSTSAYADGHTMAFSDMQFDAKTNLNASELIGMRVYASEAQIENDATIAADGEKKWDDIGEINEIVLTRSGDVQSVIVGVGGFLGMGEKNVAIDMSQLKFVTEDGEDDFFLVVNASTAGVEDAPDYTPMGAMTKEPVDEAAAETTTEEAETNDAMAATDVDAEMADKRAMLTPPSVEREGYGPAVLDDLTAEDLTGTRVYGVNDEDVGEISELLLTDAGMIDRVVIDVGGFLGMGEHSVAVTMDELQIVRSDELGDVRVYIDSSEEALKQQPEYEG